MKTYRLYVTPRVSASAPKQGENSLTMHSPMNQYLTISTSFLALTVLFAPVFACRSSRTPDEAATSKTERGSAMSIAVKSIAVTPIAVTTKAFSPGDAIPKDYTCDGADTSPELSWSGAPSGVQSFALMAEDPDAPVGTWTHWLIWNIPAQNTGLPTGIPKDEFLSDGARQGLNNFRRIGYSGPCPPSGNPHRYFFKLYALDSKLDLKSGANRDALEQAMTGHVLAQGELMGKYGR